MQENTENIVKRLKAVIETAIDGIITIDNRGVVESINKAAADMFGYQPQEVIGRNISMFMPEPHHSAHDGYIKRFLKTHEPRIIGVGRDVTGIKKNGDPIYLRLAVSEVKLDDRVIFTGILHDLTEVKNIQNELLRMNEELEAKVEERTNELESVINRLLKLNHQLKESERELKNALDREIELSELKTRFVSMASHEFRTPLSTILSSAVLIGRYKKEEDDANRLRHVKRIKSAITNLNGILNDFMSLSKMEEGQMEVVPSEIDIRDLTNLVVDEMQGLLKPGQQINLIQPEDIVLYSDNRMLKNILFNLLSNATKYSGEGDAIEVGIHADGQHLYCHITDEGIGIPEPDQKYLFNRFFRASNAETIQGTGLGLNIVTQYLSLLNGQIDFVSKEGKGSTFTIQIPLRYERNPGH